MTARRPHPFLSAVLAMSLLVTTALAHAGSTAIRPSFPASERLYARLAADWLEWVLEIPAGVNPLFDSDGANAAVGQSGHVWFLAGTATSGAVTRTISVPAGVALFFPIVNYFWVNATEYGDPPWSPEQKAWARAYLAETVDTAQDLLLKVDGRRVMNVQRLRVRSAVGACVLPDDNIFGVPLEPREHECIADGYWALLPPLSAGRHTIHFGGGFAASGFALDVTYEITVRRH